MNEFWNELSKERQTIIINKYKNNSNKEANKILEDLFGEENLNPIKIRTWDDVLRYKLSKSYNDMLNNYYNDLLVNVKGNSLVNRLIAIIKITKIIEYGFGGLVNKTDIDEQCAFTIRLKRNRSNYIMCKDFNFEIVVDHNGFDLLSFRSTELAQEFIRNNNELLKQYFMIF